MSEKPDLTSRLFLIFFSIEEEYLKKRCTSYEIIFLIIAV
ncbi:hypothetical protein EFW58_00423 [Bacillus velezensis]|nr:hypothetical protein EFW58_00423 [Bacillus velezensis]